MPNEAPDATNSESRAVAPSDSAESLEWAVHPVMRSPWVSVGVSLFIAAVVVAVKWATGSQAFSILAMVVMLGSLAKFYFPTRYQLDNTGITVKTMTQTLHKDWSVYRSCYPDKNGILLSPFTEPSRLENFRGLYIMFNRNADIVTQFCRTRVDTTSKVQNQTPEATS